MDRELDFDSEAWKEQKYKGYLKGFTSCGDPDFMEHGVTLNVDSETEQYLQTK